MDGESDESMEKDKVAQVGRGESDTWSRIYIHHL